MYNNYWLDRRKEYCAIAWDDGTGTGFSISLSLNTPSYPKPINTRRLTRSEYDILHDGIENYHLLYSKSIKDIDAYLLHRTIPVK